MTQSYDVDSTGIVHLPVPHRRLIHPQTVLYEPNPIDLWLIANKPSAWYGPVGHFSSAGYPLLSEVLFDQVLCNFFLDVSEVCWLGQLEPLALSSIANCTLMQTPCSLLDKSDTYTLYLTVTAPVSSGLPINALISPRVIIAQYEGYCFDSQAPFWTGMRPGFPLVFRQPRGAMAELFHGVAIWAENLAVVSEVSQLLFQS
jgi:hypothetical protein